MFLKRLSISLIAVHLSTPLLAQPENQNKQRGRKAAQQKDKEPALAKGDKILEKISKILPKDAEIIWSEKIQVEDQPSVYRVKYQVGSESYSQEFTLEGLRNELKASKEGIASNALEKTLKQAELDQKIKVILSLKAAPIPLDDTDQPEAAEVRAQGNQSELFINGRAVSIGEYDANEKKKQDKRNKRLTVLRERVLAARSNLLTILKQYGASIPADGEQDNLEIELTRAQIEQLQDKKEFKQSVESIDLYRGAKNHLVQAVSNGTEQTQYAHNVSTRRGAGIGIYITETGCPGNARGLPSPFKIWEVYGTVAEATNEGDQDHARLVMKAARASAPDAFLYCNPRSQLPTDGTKIKGTGVPVEVQIVNLSFGYPGPVDYIDQDATADNFVYNYDIPIFASAGNDGNNKIVVSPARGLNVIGVGSWDDDTWNVSRFTNLQNPSYGTEKPDLFAPGENLAFTNELAPVQSGTSFSSPIAAGLAANIMSDTPRGGNFYKNKPAALRALLLNGSAPSVEYVADPPPGISGGYANALDFYWSWIAGTYAVYFTGKNNTWSTLDNATDDPYKGNGFLDRVYSLSPGQAAASIAWTTRGSFTRDRRVKNPSQSFLGMDLDLYVYGPDGKLVKSSVSSTNTEETVRFTVPVKGNYRFVIKRFSNLDTTNDLKIGLVVSHGI